MPNNNPVPHPAEEFGKVPHASEAFGTIPKGSESFRNVPHPSERFGKEPATRKESHSLTVREVARLFEAAGVARTERSIVNWCQPNQQGISRLDCYFDPNERKYYITQTSVEMAIAEEKAKAQKPANPASEAFGTVPNKPEPDERATRDDTLKSDADEVKALKQEVMDLKITNKGKDYFIEQLQKEREGLLQQVVDSSRKVGELETRLLQLESGSDTP